MTLWLALAILFAVAVGVYLYRSRSAHRVAADVLPIVHDSVTHADVSATSDDVDSVIVPFETEATVKMTAEIYTLAFSVARFDYQILGDHLNVLRESKEAVLRAVNEQRYFPRKPALLPKLLRALNTGDSSREEIVRLILQDPVLAGNVLKRANSAFYHRHNNSPVESIDRAVVLLGNDGLRVPVATAIMQPVFHLPRGFFEQFAPITWELAERTAIAAETYARMTRAGDVFVAHLLGLLGGLGRIVLFRMTLDKYRNYPNLMPRAEVFIRVMMDHDREVTRTVAAAWEMSPAFLDAIDAQIEQTLPQRMTPLASTLYYANLCGALTVLSQRDKLSRDDARTLLSEQGLNAELFDAMWAVAFSKELA